MPKKLPVKHGSDRLPWVGRTGAPRNPASGSYRAVLVGGNAEVVDLKQQDGSTVTTFAVATKEVRGAGEARKEYTTWHKVAVYRGLQKFAATIEKGDLILVSGPIYTRSFASKNGKVETYAVRANTLDMLKRKNARSTEAPVEEAAPDMEDAPF